MRTTVDLPEYLYEKSEAIAASRGTTVEMLIVEAVAKEVREYSVRDVAIDHADREPELPVIASARPGTLDLSRFDFDDLLT